MTTQKIVLAFTRAEMATVLQALANQRLVLARLLVETRGTAAETQIYDLIRETETLAARLIAVVGDLSDALPTAKEG